MRSKSRVLLGGVWCTRVCRGTGVCPQRRARRLNGTNNAITDLFEWDTTEPIATRPLFWQARTSSDNYSLFYTHDGNKNVSEAVFYQRARGVAAHYEYAPFGEVIVQTRGNAWGSLDLSILNPWRFSSEYDDDTLGLVYYNYRHYEPMMGRWLSRDPMEEDGGGNLFVICRNCPAINYDKFGLFGDGYIEECVRSHDELVVLNSGMIFIQRVCDEWVRKDADYKGHSQFSNNGTECPFDYTKEDRGWSNPFFMPWRHFQDLSESCGKVKSAISLCDASAFERAMHQAQDYYAHYGKGYRWWKGGHVKDGTKPDEDDKAWKEAEKLTLSFMLEWTSKCCLTCPKKDCKWVKKGEGDCAQ